MLSFTAQLNYSEFRAAVATGAGVTLPEGLRVLKRLMIADYRAPKSGKQRRNQRRASARGESPARQSGHLESTITEPRMVGPFTAQMEVTAIYAERLHLVLDRPLVTAAMIEDLRMSFQPIGI